mgnify:CR=1 FL=1
MNYRVVRIEEDVEFGCEERKEGDPVMAVVRLEDEDGDVKIVRQRDQMLYDRDINEGDRVWLMKRQELESEILPAWTKDWLHRRKPALTR